LSLVYTSSGTVWPTIAKKTRTRKVEIQEKEEEDKYEVELV